MLNLRDLTDEDLTTLENDVLAERERRQRLANAPAQIASMTERFLADGGDPDALLPVPEVEPEENPNADMPTGWIR